jgi:hypothetical protein
MSKATFSLRNFRSEVSRRGLARPTRFEVIIPTPIGLRSSFTSQETNIVSLFCEAAVLPPQIIGVKQQRIIGPAYQRPVGVEFGGEGLPMTFLLDQQMDVKGFFDSWLNKVVHPFQFYVSYPDQYVTNIDIHQLDEQNNYTYSIRLVDAFPRSMNIVDLNHSNQNQISKLNVNFAYRRWYSSQKLANKVPYSILADNSISETERRSLARNQSLPPSNVTDENQSDAETRRLSRQAI